MVVRKGFESVFTDQRILKLSSVDVQKFDYGTTKLDAKYCYAFMVDYEIPHDVKIARYWGRKENCQKCSIGIIRNNCLFETIIRAYFI